MLSKLWFFTDFDKVWRILVWCIINVYDIFGRYFHDEVGATRGGGEDDKGKHKDEEYLNENENWRELSKQIEKGTEKEKKNINKKKKKKKKTKKKKKKTKKNKKNKDKNKDKDKDNKNMIEFQVSIYLYALVCIERNFTWDSASQELRVCEENKIFI